jgi:hypothetical protein
MGSFVVALVITFIIFKVTRWFTDDNPTDYD